MNDDTQELELAVKSGTAQAYEFTPQSTRFNGKKMHLVDSYSWQWESETVTDTNPALLFSTVLFYPDGKRPVQALPNDDISTFIGTMSREQKAAQVVMYNEPTGTLSVNNTDVYPGGCLDGGGGLADLSFEQVKARMNAVYLNANGSGAAPIPPLYGTDSIHGASNVKDVTLFPHNISFGNIANQSDRIQAAENWGYVTREEMKSLRMPMSFNPCLATVRNQSYGRYYEGFSEDPNIGVDFVKPYIENLQGGAFDLDPITGRRTYNSIEVLATAKHLVGEGELHSQHANTNVDRDVLENRHMRLFKEAIHNGVGCIMAAYNALNGLDCHVNWNLLTKRVKHELEFDGFILGDWSGHTPDYGRNGANTIEAIKAGVDMLMVGSRGDATTEANVIYNAMNGGDTVLEARVNEAVYRILTIKKKLGFFELNGTSLSIVANDTRYTGQADPADVIRSPAHLEKAKFVVEKSSVLLLNKGQLLPINPNTYTKIYVVGQSAITEDEANGGWTVDWAGLYNMDIVGKTLFEHLVSKLGDKVQYVAVSIGTDGETVVSSADLINGFAIAEIAIEENSLFINVMGSSPYVETGGDGPKTLSNYRMQLANENLAAIAKLNKPMVNLLYSGSPIIMDATPGNAGAAYFTQGGSPNNHAFIWAALPGTELDGLSDMLFTDGPKFTGKLGVSWPKKITDNSTVFSDESYDASKMLFEKGHGMTWDQNIYV